MKLYSIEYFNGYTVVISPTKWLYRCGERFLVEGIDANGDMHAITDQHVLRIDVYYSEELEQTA